MTEEKYVKARLNGLALDVSTNSPVVILSPEDSDKVLPIWIGHFEAWAIGMEISNMPSKRPLTHDLLKNSIELLGGKVEKIVVTELKEQTFFAKIYIVSDGQTYELDARPSDSIALALKAKAPIYVNPELFRSAPMPTGEGKQKPLDAESLRERLRNIDPEDFGKYSL